MWHEDARGPSGYEKGLSTSGEVRRCPSARSSLTLGEPSVPRARDRPRGRTVGQDTRGSGPTSLCRSKGARRSSGGGGYRRESLGTLRGSVREEGRTNSSFVSERPRRLRNNGGRKYPPFLTFLFLLSSPHSLSESLCDRDGRTRTRRGTGTSEDQGVHLGPVDGTDSVTPVVFTSLSRTPVDRRDATVALSRPHLHSLDDLSSESQGFVLPRVVRGDP